MKFLLIFSIVLQLSLFSTTLEDEGKYKEGIDYYKLHQFQNSFEILYSIYMKYLADLNFNFYFGRSAYETGHYELALAAFERVEMQDPSNIRNRLEMARTYYMLKMYEDAENAFNDVLANPNIPQTIRKDIEVSLSRVSKVQQRSFTYSRVMLDALYDSNVNYGSFNDYEYGGYKWKKSNTQSDIAAQLYANVTNIYDIGEKNSFVIKNSLSIYSKNYYEQKAYNILYASYSPSLLYQERRYTAQLSLVVDTTTLGESHYLYTLSLIPSIQYNHTNTLCSILKFKYQNKDFIQDAQNDLDASHYELSYGLQKILTPHSYLHTNLTGASETSIRGHNIYVNYNEYKIDATYVNQFSSKFAFDFYTQAKMRTYNDYSRGFNSTRDDMGGVINGGITMLFTPTLRGSIKAIYEYVDSNQDRFSYQKFTASAGLIKTF